MLTEIADCFQVIFTERKMFMISGTLSQGKGVITQLYLTKDIEVNNYVLYATCYGSQEIAFEDHWTL